jgi:transposase
MGRESRETWATRVERWKDSGLTAKEYAMEIGVNAHSLTWWKWRLSSMVATSGPAGRPRTARKASSDRMAPLAFVELPASAAGEPFEVVLSSSLRVRVPSGFDATALRRLLDVLAARP